MKINLETLFYFDPNNNNTQSQYFLYQLHHLNPNLFINSQYSKSEFSFEFIQNQFENQI